MPSAQTDLLKGLSSDEAAKVMALGKLVSIPAGSALFNLGDQADRVYLVVRGRIALTLPIQIRGAEEDVLVEERLAGETLGWSGLIPPYRFTLKATASVESELLSFSREQLLGHFAAYPPVGYTVTGNVAAVIGHRLQVFQTMWVREMQRVVELRYP
jgi:CRP/FNR family transcriptional regulator, cyclic AMP receptor protein